jgi:hypothetical protein
MARTTLARIPAGCYRFTDWLDDGGQGQEDIPIRLAISTFRSRKPSHARCCVLLMEQYGLRTTTSRTEHREADSQIS